MKIFLDDVRPAPDNTWTTAKTYQEAVKLLSENDVDEISLDHDLGDGQPTGHDLAKWMTKNKKWPAQAHFHTANPAGKSNMEGEYNFYLKHKDQIP